MIHLSSAISETEISTMLDVPVLVKLLNVALSAELIAVIQYKLGAIVVRGIGRDELVRHMEDHESVEYEHAGKLLIRINELGGTPTTDINTLMNNPTAPYAEPTSSDLNTILDQSLKSEQEAIKLYTKIAEYVKDRDHVTYALITEILADEQEHERDFISLKEDLA